MNLIAIDIGNTNITFALYIDNEEKSIDTFSGTDSEMITDHLKKSWEKMPVAKGSTEGKKDAVILISSVKPAWTDEIKKMAKELLNEKARVIGQDIPYPMDIQVEEIDRVGADRVMAASAAFAVTENALVVADFGTAVTIDIVDERGIFLGGCIFPGFQMAARSLKDSTAQLPMVEVSHPDLPFGKSTEEAINNGLYYSAIGALEEIVRRYSETLGYWPQTVITGSGAAVIKDDCPFVDNYVPNLITKGIALAYRKYLESRENAG